MGCYPYKEEPDIWTRERNSLYEYIAVYVDDLAIAAKDPKEITDALTTNYKFKLKGTGPIKYDVTSSGMKMVRYVSHQENI